MGLPWLLKAPTALYLLSECLNLALTLHLSAQGLDGSAPDRGTISQWVSMSPWYTLWRLWIFYGSPLLRHLFGQRGFDTENGLHRPRTSASSPDTYTVHVYLCVYVCMYVCMYVCTYTHPYACSCTCKFIVESVYMCIYTCSHTHIYVMYVYIYIYTHTRV